LSVGTVGFGDAGAVQSFFGVAGSGFSLLIPGNAFLSFSQSPSRSRTNSENVIMVNYLRASSTKKKPDVAA